MDHLNQTKPTNKWKVSTVVLAVIAAGLIAGLLYINYQRNLTAGRLNQITSERNEAQRQLAIAKGDTDGTDTHATAGSDYTSAKGVAVVVTSPAKDTTIKSPLTVSGKVPGNWSFEGQFGVMLKASDGTVIDSSAAKLDGDWMTDELVSFTAQLTWDNSATGSATLVLEKANPSDLSANEDTVEIPIKF